MRFGCNQFDVIFEIFDPEEGWSNATNFVGQLGWLMKEQAGQF